MNKDSWNIQKQRLLSGRQYWLTRMRRHDIALVLARAFGPALMREAADRARLT